MSGVVGLRNGGTGATTAPQARAGLGLGAAATADFGTTAGTVADGGAVAAGFAAAITIGGSPILAAQRVAIMAAAGVSTSDAPQAASAINVLKSVAVGAGVRLTAQQTTVVINRGLNTLSVYPPLGGTIEGGPVDTGVQVPPGGSATFVSDDAATYFAI